MTVRTVPQGRKHGRIETGYRAPSTRARPALQGSSDLDRARLDLGEIDGDLGRGDAELVGDHGRRVLAWVTYDDVGLPLGDCPLGGGSMADVARRPNSSRLPRTDASRAGMTGSFSRIGATRPPAARRLLQSGGVSPRPCAGGQAVPPPAFRNPDDEQRPGTVEGAVDGRRRRGSTQPTPACRASFHTEERVGPASS